MKMGRASTWPESKFQRKKNLSSTKRVETVYAATTKVPVCILRKELLSPRWATLGLTMKELKGVFPNAGPRAKLVPRTLIFESVGDGASSYKRPIG